MSRVWLQIMILLRVFNSLLKIRYFRKPQSSPPWYFISQISCNFEQRGPFLIIKFWDHWKINVPVCYDCQTAPLSQFKPHLLFIWRVVLRGISKEVSYFALQVSLNGSLQLLTDCYREPVGIMLWSTETNPEFKYLLFFFLQIKSRSKKIMSGYFCLHQRADE